jgi:hypothetical protein
MEPLLLLAAVREVSLLADPDRPSRVSQRAFDAVSAEIAVANPDSQLAKLPSARAISRKLNRSWSDVLDLAHAPPKTQAQRFGGRRRGWLTAEHVAYLLRLAAKRLNVNALTEEQYMTEREAITAMSRMHYLHGHRLRLPTVAQITSLMRVELYGSSAPGTYLTGTWERALEIAGLDAPKPSAAIKPTPVGDLLDRYAEAHDSEPTSHRLWRFAQEQGLPYVIVSEQSFRRTITYWRKRRRADGHSSLRPPEPPTAGENALAYFRAPRKPKKSRKAVWTDPENCLRAITRYLKQVPAGEHATASGYAAWAKLDGNAPSPTALRKHGGWTKMREIAQKRMLRSR